VWDERLGNVSACFPRYLKSVNVQKRQLELPKGQSPDWFKFHISSFILHTSYFGTRSGAVGEVVCGVVRERVGGD
jgi:hypothetical protein